MQIRQGNRLTGIRGADAFIDEHAAEIPLTAASGKRAHLKAQIAALDQTGKSQQGNTRIAAGFVTKQTELRKTLLSDHMLPISRIAFSDLPHTPELSALRQPTTSISNEQLIMAADGMAIAAEPHVDVFIAAGLPTDFIQQLRQVAEDLKHVIDSRTVARGKRGGARISLGVQLADARKTVRVLDSLVRRELRGNSELLAAWNVMKKTPVKPVRKTEEEPTTTPATPTGSTPATPPTPTKAPTAA